MGDASYFSFPVVFRWINDHMVGLVVLGLVLWVVYLCAEYGKWLDSPGYKAQKLFKAHQRSKAAEERRVHNQTRAQARHECNKVYAEQKKAAAERRAAEYAKRRHEATQQAERKAARNHLWTFYKRHRKLLSSECPSDLLLGFIASEMSEEVSWVRCWAVATAKINEFRPVITREEERLRKENQRKAETVVRQAAKQRELKTLRDYVEKLKKSPVDPTANNLEILKHEAVIQQIEAELRDGV